MNREEANQLKVTQLNDKMFRNHLEDCLAFGKVRRLLRRLHYTTMQVPATAVCRTRCGKAKHDYRNVLTTGRRPEA
jgi:hypothetical protein